MSVITTEKKSNTSIAIRLDPLSELCSSDQQNKNNERLNKLARRLCLPVVTIRLSGYDFHLIFEDDLLYLQERKSRICVNFSSGEVNFRREFGGGKNQTIGRAIGLNKRKNLNVLDTTAGLGGDAFVLACLGCKVTLLERSPIVSALLSDGLRRGLLDENISHIIEHMVLNNVDAKTYLSQLDEKPDVIYLDPMYPRRKKTAKVKKEMQILQRLLGHDAESSYLTLAIQKAGQRVVVKRPKGAEYLDNSAPSHSIESKKTRYDVYLCGL